MLKGSPLTGPLIEQSGELTATEHAAMHAITEVARCLLRGQELDHHFNPVPRPASEVEELVKLMWRRSGRLHYIEKADKRHKHAKNIDEAMLRKRVFTCTRQVYETMPKTRPRSK